MTTPQYQHGSSNTPTLHTTPKNGHTMLMLAPRASLIPSKPYECLSIIMHNTIAPTNAIQLMYEASNTNIS